MFEVIVFFLAFGGSGWLEGSGLGRFRELSVWAPQTLDPKPLDTPSPDPTP